MQTIIRLLLATGMVLGLASTIVASAHPVHHTEFMRNGIETGLPRGYVALADLSGRQFS